MNAHALSRRMLLAGAVFAVGVASATLTAHAADPGVSGVPSGTLRLDAKAAAAGVGYTWGDGTLSYHGQSHRFSVQGITVADVGYAHIIGRGRVYNLHKLADFSGTYVAATGEATLVKGLGGQILRNANGVEIRVDEVTKGARLSGSADGIKLVLTH